MSESLLLRLLDRPALALAVSTASDMHCPAVAGLAQWTEADGQMRLEEVLTVLSALHDAGVETWLEGGWGVDALVGRQTRDHRDVDVDVDATHEATALEVLGALGYAVQTDWRPTRVEFVAAGRGWVDLHPLTFSSDGDARQAAPDGTFWHIPKRYFSTGRLDHHTVGCYTVEAQRAFHAGYDLRPRDRLDLVLLDQLESAGNA